MSFDYLKGYIPGGEGDDDNWFLPVNASEIDEAEKKLGFSFPSELRKFYREIGFGMLRSPKNKPEDYRFYSNNFILHPLVTAGFTKGILLFEEYGAGMLASARESLAKDDLLFFEMYDSSHFLIMKPKSRTPNAVWNQYGRIKIEDSFERFVWRLYHEDPGYYGDVIENYYEKRDEE